MQWLKQGAEKVPVASANTHKLTARRTHCRGWLESKKESPAEMICTCRDKVIKRAPTGQPIGSARLSFHVHTPQSLFTKIARAYVSQVQVLSAFPVPLCRVPWARMLNRAAGPIGEELHPAPFSPGGVIPFD